MKTSIKMLVISGLLTMAFSTSCQKDMINQDNALYASVLDVSSDGTSTLISQNMQSAFVMTSGLTDAELTSLLKMKDEEKLAHDVYSALYQKWGSQVFSRISTAENNHLNAIIRLLQYYDSPDTLIGEQGIFRNSVIQSLYNNLITKGSESFEEAYKVGALIEEMDIKDLSDAILEISNANIIMVYENLRRGSRNHLRAFNNQLTNVGVSYTPVYLTQAEYDQIVTSAMERGNQYQMGNGNGKGNGNCNVSGQRNRNGKN